MKKKILTFILILAVLFPIYAQVSAYIRQTQTIRLEGDNRANAGYFVSTLEIDGCKFVVTFSTHAGGASNIIHHPACKNHFIK